MSWTGPTPVVQVVKGGIAYEAVSATTAFAEVSFGFGATQLHIINEAATRCEFSFDGSTVKGTVLEKSNDNATCAGQTSVYVRLVSGSGTIYVRAY